MLPGTSGFDAEPGLSVLRAAKRNGFDGPVEQRIASLTARSVRLAVRELLSVRGV